MVCRPPDLLFGTFFPFDTGEELLTRALIVYLFTEAFIVCQDYTPPKDYVPNMGDPMLDLGTIFLVLKDIERKAIRTHLLTYAKTVLHFEIAPTDSLGRSNRTIVPFIACGDLRCVTLIDVKGEGELLTVLKINREPALLFLPIAVSIPI